MKKLQQQKARMSNILNEDLQPEEGDCHTSGTEPVATEQASAYMAAVAKPSCFAGLRGRSSDPKLQRHDTFSDDRRAAKEQQSRESRVSNIHANSATLLYRIKRCIRQREQSVAFGIRP